MVIFYKRKRISEKEAGLSAPPIPSPLGKIRSSGPPIDVENPLWGRGKRAYSLIL